ncbi:MAG: S-layer homology domain-containing protein [Oscillospiraceae bacterium]|nr:S-layer homology domain-containing protein [Oscillospiraceae bacterium]
MKLRKLCVVAWMLLIVMIFSALQISSIVALEYEESIVEDMIGSDTIKPDVIDSDMIDSDMVEIYAETYMAEVDMYMADMYVFSPDELGAWLQFSDAKHVTDLEEVYYLELPEQHVAFAAFSAPIIVNNRAELVNALTTPEAHRMIKLNADIDLGAWTPINLSDEAAWFTLDGNGHSLTFSVNSGNGPAGFLGTVSGGNVTILNLGLNINGSIRRHGNAYRGAEQMIAGALMGRVHGGRVLIERTSVMGGEIYARRNAANTHGDAFAGGLIGVVQNSADVIIIDSFVHAHVRAYAVAGTGILSHLRMDTPRAVAGGLVGMLWGSSSLRIVNSYAAGSVYARSRSASVHLLPTALRSVGGILGAIWDKTDSALGMNMAHANNVSHSGDLLGSRNTTHWGAALSESQLRNNMVAPLNRWNWDTVWEYRVHTNNGLPVLRADGFTGIIAPEFIVMYHGLSGQYNQNIAILAAELLYCWPYSDLNYAESLAYWGFELPREGFDMSADNAFVRFGIKTLPNGINVVAVILRGTSGELREWMGNFTTGIFTNNFDGKHADFARAAQVAHMQLLVYLNDHDIELTSDRTRFLIAGSSRGAAIANILSYRLMSDNGVSPNHLFSYNFAGPDVAVRHMRSWGNYNNIINIRNFNDPVTRVPGTIGNVILTMDMPGYNWGKFGQSLWWPGSVGIFSTLFAGLEFTYYDPHNIPYYRHQVMHYPLPWGNTCGVRHFLALVTAFKCPVDIRVYDDDGVHVATVSDNELVYFNACVERLQIFIIDDAKYIVFLDESAYDIHLMGTDSGILNYFVKTIEITEETVPVDEYFSTIEASFEILEQRVFVDVALYDGRQMLTAVGGDIDVSDVALLLAVDDVIVGAIDESGNEQLFENTVCADNDAQDHNICTQDAATSHPSESDVSDAHVPDINEPELYSNNMQRAHSVSMPFDDVAAASWYYSYVRLMWQQQLFQGTAPNIFAPRGDITRAMFVQVLANLNGVDLLPYATQQASFDDTLSSSWYFGAVVWAARQGIVSGVGDGRFAPNRSITRQEMVVLLNNYIEARDVTLPQHISVAFTDLDDIAPWAVDGVAMMQGAGIIVGHADGRFAPQDVATRAEAAAMFARFLDLYRD